MGAPLLAQGSRETAELNRSASALFAQREFDKAISQLRRSLQIDPRQIGPMKMLGLCYQLANQLEQAEGTLVALTKLAPKDPEAWFFLGRVYYLQNFFDKALAALETATLLNPRDYRISQQLALTLEISGDTERAVKTYQEAIRLNETQPPPAAGLYADYGSLLYKLNQLDRAERHLKRPKS